MEKGDLTTITKELEEWERSTNNMLKECQIYIDNVDKTCYEARLTNEHKTIKSFNNKKFLCNHCPFQSNWRSSLSTHQTNQHKDKINATKSSNAFGSIDLIPALAKFSFLTVRHPRKAPLCNTLILLLDMSSSLR